MIGGVARARALNAPTDTRCPGAWEPVHGHIEPGEEPEDAAIREVREESGLVVDRLYNACVQPFYLHKTHTLQWRSFSRRSWTLGAWRGGDREEHQRAEWLSVEDALHGATDPAESGRRTDDVELLSSDVGAVSDDG